MKLCLGDSPEAPSFHDGYSSVTIYVEWSRMRTLFRRGRAVLCRPGEDVLIGHFMNVPHHVFDYIMVCCLHYLHE